MGRLNSKQRKALPRSDFAVPSKAPGSGSYPVNDPAHARNALARVAQHGSPADKAAVRAKVHEKFPNIGKGAKPKAEAKSGSGGRHAVQPPQQSPRPPEPDNRSQSSQFRAPPPSRGGPKAPPAIARSPMPGSGHDRGHRAAERGATSGASGIDRAMSAHADRVHPRR